MSLYYGGVGQTILFSESLEQAESVGMVFDNIGGTFEFDPLINSIFRVTKLTHTKIFVY